ncbi:hypothetical protein [Croceicoccus sp. Ery5]|uniref:hypothetical protein n=1 Tax=Croceicoccus sp. Ery5 TaxID=1703340 RepID=UPI001E4E8A19|nr:hypothetical protein [Croceicoccus sp. Ery5]
MATDEYGGIWVRLGLLAISLTFAGMQPAAAQDQSVETTEIEGPAPYRVIKEDAQISFMSGGTSSRARSTRGNDPVIAGWVGHGNSTLFLRDRRDRWYRAELIGTCCELSLVRDIGFESGGMNAFNRRSVIVIRGHSYGLKSFDQIEWIEDENGGAVSGTDEG